MGRFLSRDTWAGDVNRPGSLNRWGYVEGNPINATDPSGNITQKQSERADLILSKLQSIYGIRIKKDWGYKVAPATPSSPYIITGFMFGCEWEPGNWRNVKELQITLDSVKNMSNKLGGSYRFIAAMKHRPVEVVRYKESKYGGYAYYPPSSYILGDVALYDNTFNSGEEYSRWVVVHEMAHVWDFRNNFILGYGLADHINAYRRICDSGCDYVWDPDQSERVEQHFITQYAKTNELELWADSFAAFVYPSYYVLVRTGRSLTPEVESYISKIIDTKTRIKPRLLP